ncbi:MAG: 2OG-Fe(II) oxygenase family protein [Nanoarchaeota archaeon]
MDFAKNMPFPHLLIESFLGEKEAERLALALKKEEFEEKDSDLFSFKQTQDLHYSENKEIKEFVKMLESREFAERIEKISGIKVKKGAFDLAGSLYENTDYLLCHDDELEGRKIAYVYYLCEDFSEKDGGALALLEDDNGKPGKSGKRYSPKWNSLMIFEVSKRSWHEVEEVIGKKKRYAIGGWLH